MGGGAHLQRMFPVQKVRYMHFTGEFIDAMEAYRLGAVVKVVSKELLRAAVFQIDENCSEKPDDDPVGQASANGDKR